MAARPNTVRTLLCGQRLADNQIKRLEAVIEMTQRVLDENKLLTADDVSLYKECLRAAKKQLSAFTKIRALEIPDGETSTRRTKRGRPSKDELAALKADRTGENPKPKRRGRPKKATTEDTQAEAAPAPKKRGRPRKVQIDETTIVAEVKPKRRGRPPKDKPAEAVTAPAPKKRGRPRKNPEPEVAVVTEAPKRKRGRPKGSKNKPKVLNGSATAAA